MAGPAPRSALFPYTTLFRSPREAAGVLDAVVGPVKRRLLRGPHPHQDLEPLLELPEPRPDVRKIDRKSTRLNSSHITSSYAVFCLKKKRWTSLCAYGSLRYT